MIISRFQLKAGRCTAGLTMSQLAIAASVSLPTVQQLEQGRVLRIAREKVRIALEERGIRFLPDNGIALASGSVPATA